jgi:beta propeller repeat protein
MPKKYLQLAALIVLISLIMTIAPACAGGDQTGDLSGTLSSVSVINPEYDRGAPSIDGDRIVWQELGDSGYRIHLYNCTSGEETIISPGGLDSQNPVISGDSVVWNRWWNGPADIYLSTIAGTNVTKITMDPAGHSSPDISGDSIVYVDFVDGNGEVYLYSVSTGSSRRLTFDAGNHANPLISGNNIVWESWVNEAADLYLYDITKNQTSCLSDAPADQKNPAIDGDRIVWEDWSGGNGAIYLYNITTNLTKRLSDNPSQQTNPEISGDRIVWEDQRGGLSEIYIHSLSMNTTQRVAGTGYSQFLPVISGNRIVWVEFRDPGSDILLFTIGHTESPLIADFSANCTSGEPPLMVSFTDTSLGSPTGWNWDFGDGNSSKERDPVHTYSSSGLFTVSLIVNTPYQRNASVKADYIVAGAPPRAGFLADPVEGPAPLLVTFSDNSTGSPCSWSWDLGDGNHSDEANPVHVYQAPGLYNVTLCVSNEFGNDTLIRHQYIHVVQSSGQDILCPREGVSGEITEGKETIQCNASIVNCSVGPENRTLWIFSGASSGSSLELSDDGTGFHRDGDVISGNITKILLRSGALIPGNFSERAGSNSSVNVSVDLGNYPQTGTLSAIFWEGALSADMDRIFPRLGAANLANFIDTPAYTVSFVKENVNSTRNATIIMGVSTRWVRNSTHHYGEPVDIDSDPTGGVIYVDGNFVGVTRMTVCLDPTRDHQIEVRKIGYDPNQITIRMVDDSVRIIRIADNGTVDVLDTSPLYSDTAQGIDYFRADSPNGLSKFVLAGVARSGNPLQLLSLTISSHPGPGSGGSSSNGGGGYSGGGSSGGGAGASAASQVTSVPTGTGAVSTQAPEQVLTTVQPTNLPGTSENRETASATSTVPGAVPNPKVAAVTPGSSIFTTLIQVIAVFAVVAITAVALYSRWRRGGIG